MFRIIRNSTTADAADMNDNFYHIGQGSIMPMDGNYLYSTDSSCNLGSATYKWDNGFIDNIDCTTLNCSTITATKAWCLLYDIDSSVNTLTSRMEFDVSMKEFSEFIIYGVLNNIDDYGNIYINLYINYGSLSSYVGHNYYFNNGAGTGSSAITGYMRLLGTGYSINAGFFRVNISGSVGDRRICTFETVYQYYTAIELEYGEYFWTNTSSTITSLVITDLYTSTTMRIYGR